MVLIFALIFMTFGRYIDDKKSHLKHDLRARKV